MVFVLNEVKSYIILFSIKYPGILDSIYSKEAWLHLQWVRVQENESNTKNQRSAIKYNSLSVLWHRTRDLLTFTLFIYIKKLPLDYIITLNILWKTEFNVT